jgi:hypothetical protein
MAAPIIRKHAGHGNETADRDLEDFCRLPEFFRPQAPEEDGDEKKTDRHDRIQRNQPRGGHFFSKENKIGMVLRPNQISVEDLLVGNDRDGQKGQKRQ